MTAINDPITLPCGATLKNRLCKAAMTEGLGDDHNRATERHVTLYQRWARGGAGLLLTGNIMVDRRYLERPGNVAIDGPQTAEQMAALGRYASAATEHGAHIWAQISHAGRQSPKIVATEPVGPSAIELALPGGQFGRPRALSAEDIEDVINRFVEAARVVQEAGFTGVQIHAAHGYLVSEFLNPLTNLRRDEWGGSLENRARLLLRIVSSVRDKVGPDFPISVKLNSSDFQKGGFSLEDCLQVVRWLNDTSIDLLEISGGNYEQPRMMGIEGMEPVFEEGISASTRAREAYFIAYAERIAEIATMPLLVTGGFRSRAGMDEALTSGAADVIGLGRPLCVDTALPEQLLSGDVASAHSYEKELAIGPGILGPGSGIPLIKALNGFGAMAFFYQNIFRLADGLPAKRKMALLPAFIKHQSHEAKAAKALKGR
ncbi:NADH:flavin oxidoreductase/NADH oxidase family protein [Parvularcula sp. IMCC14364]|uniref:NADH:flavin oxidoreductase/NADH oxidase family protein n=1 Tax=Parvularcula sp. IMCC14364 TaxID=3067902 RepID=UPI002740AADC|nr:NADH:flavin oxidoreductase/NADH oxidase family protein [Parvularcula sp. IMCC14364]